MVFRRVLNFTAKEAKQPFTLMIFTQPETKPYILYNDLFPVAWKVITFNDSSSHASVVFEMNLKAFVSHKTQGNVVRAATSKDVSEGQSVSVVMAGNLDAPIFKESSGVAVPGATVHIENNTGSFQSLGLMISGTPAVLFPNVGPENNVEIKMSPKIYLAVNQTHFEAGGIIRSHPNTVSCIDLSTFHKDSVDVAVGQDENGFWTITTN
ncbi:predicted protein [Naegleria gruberi]|uniref:Predicted protein n=1 Tax=Naegleria gruberi TaxID=5762 RepID=D2VFB0_NAEGR|nr:uncharacterized protein NAEGRDRAFT_79731 [Naegleria gruberi]EFC44429.1 predicted protein [Naegleria gruberi]|eukprot:XP_002677173.1 predicted protein [Naegleria gruberi strain NEG-M]